MCFAFMTLYQKPNWTILALRIYFPYFFFLVIWFFISLMNILFLWRFLGTKVQFKDPLMFMFNQIGFNLYKNLFTLTNLILGKSLLGWRGSWATWCHEMGRGFNSRTEQLLCVIHKSLLRCCTCFFLRVLNTISR